MTTKTIDGKAETPAERYKRISDLVHATPSNAPAPITYRDALFALDYVANDATASQELREESRRTRCTIINHIRTRMAAENGGQA